MDKTTDTRTAAGRKAIDSLVKKALGARGQSRGDIAVKTKLAPSSVSASLLRLVTAGAAKRDNGDNPRKPTYSKK